MNTLYFLLQPRLHQVFLHLRGLKELKFKESNRLIEMADSLKNSGVDLEVEENSLKN